MRLCVTVLAFLVAVHCEELFTGDQVFRIHAESEDHITALKELEGNQHLGLDFWAAISTKLPVDIRVPYTSLHTVKNFLRAKKVPFSVTINNVQELLDKEKAEMLGNAAIENMTNTFNFGAYHNLETIYSWMDTLVAGHINLVSKVEIGNSYESRPMYVLKFSTSRVNRPAIWIDAGIHSREWISQASAVWIANKIATDYKNNITSVTSLLGKVDIYLMIVFNPDGYVYSHTRNRLWRKNRSVTPNPICPGVDLNRNWDAGFGGPGASKDPCRDDYHGPSANSEIEVKNVVNLINSHRNFKSFITIHSYMQLLMYPYSYKCTDVPNESELHAVAVSASKELKSLYGTTYKVGSICKIIYQASGGSTDWAYNLGIKYSFAFELRDTGKYKFLLPADQIIPTAEETWLALKYIIKYVCDHPY